MSKKLHMLDDFLLPKEEDQKNLIQMLVMVIRKCGYKDFVCAPIVEPTPEFFPDAWSGSSESIARVFRRLLYYADPSMQTWRLAGNRDLQVVVEVEDAQANTSDTSNGSIQDSPAPPLVVRGQTLYVWYNGRNEQVIRFRVMSTALEDPRGLVAAMARAVAHAYGEHHEIMSGHILEQAQQIDLISLQLGFGLLVAIASAHYSPDRRKGKRVAPIRLSALASQDLCFLLAVQVFIREFNKSELQIITRHLPVNQKAFFSESLQLCMQEKFASMNSLLGIPDKSSWPQSIKWTELVDQFPQNNEKSIAKEQKIVVDPGVLGMNRGQPVFRVERSMALRLGRSLGLGSMMLGGIFVRSFRNGELSFAHVMIAATALGLLGLLLGKLIRESRCSEPKCGAHLEVEANVCPRCEGQVMGVISHPKQRLIAEEALKEKSN